MFKIMRFHYKFYACQGNCDTSVIMSDHIIVQMCYFVKSTLMDDDNITTNTNAHR